MKELFQSPQLTTGNFIEQLGAHEVIRALSWNQPYGSLMLHGKQETRSRATKVRGWVLMCTCQKPYPVGVIQGISGNYQRARIVDTLFREETMNLNGYAIAIGWLDTCHPMKPSDADDCFVNYSPYLYVWRFTQVHRIQPFAWKGKQGWSLLNEEQKGKIVIV